MAFTISYYDGEEEDRPELEPQLNFTSIKHAAYWCKNADIPLSVISITEWYSVDAEGNEEVLGQCNLEEAYGLEYESLDF